MAHEAFVLAVTKVTLLALVTCNLADGSCDECRKDDQVCCSDDCINGSSCLGLSCSSDLNCSRGESCCSNVCVDQPNCLGRTCSSYSDCSSPKESCCSERCTSLPSGNGCVGMSCSSDSDCGTDICCGGKCDFECRGLESTPWLLYTVAYFVPTAIGLIIFSGAAYFLYRTCADCFGCEKHAHDREVEDQRGITLQGNFPRPCQTPPSNEQEDPSNSPPYEQSPPKEPSVPPPPYSEIEEDSSGGISTSQNTYQGTLPTNYSLTVFV